MARSYTVHLWQEGTGLPIYQAKCVAINTTTGATDETQYTDSSGHGSFVALSDTQDYDVKCTWGTGNLKMFHAIFSNNATQYVLHSEVDDTPVDSVTTDPISSNWAYDHVAAADPHTGYVLESTHSQMSSRRYWLDPGIAIEDGTGSFTTGGGYNYISLPDNESIDVIFNMILPSDWVSFTSLSFLWMSEAASGNLYYRFYMTYAGHGEDYNQHNADIVIPTAVTTQGASKINVTTVTGTLFSVASAGDIIGIRFVRVGDNALDTLDTTGFLYGMYVTYVSSS